MSYQTVTLASYELHFAAMIGSWRHSSALDKGKPDAHGYDGKDGWTIHIEGAAGEMAVAKAMGWYWSGSVDTFRTGSDVGRVQVRTRSDHQYDLLIRPNTNDDDIYVLVTGQSPTFRVHGWIHAKDAKRDEWKQTYGGRPPAWFVPQTALRPMEELT